MKKNIYVYKDVGNTILPHIIIIYSFVLKIKINIVHKIECKPVEYNAQYALQYNIQYVLSYYRIIM